MPSTTSYSRGAVVLLHPSFLKRAVNTISKDLIRRQLVVLQTADLAALERALRTWLSL